MNHISRHIANAMLYAAFLLVKLNTILFMPTQLGNMEVKSCMVIKQKEVVNVKIDFVLLNVFTIQ